MKTIIETNGPVREELCQVTIRSGDASEEFFLDNAEVEQALADGHRDFLELLAENITSKGKDIIQSSYADDSDVLLNGTTVARQDLVDGLGIVPTPKFG